MFVNYPDVVSVSDIAAMLNIGSVLAYRLVKDKKIKSRKIGREYKIPKAAVIEYLMNTDSVKK